MWPFVSCVASFTERALAVHHVSPGSALPSFLWPNNVPLCGHPVLFLIHQLMNVPPLAVVINAAINTRAHVFVP